MICARDFSPPWRKINFKKQGAIRKQKIKQNKTTKDIWKNVRGGCSGRRCLEIFVRERNRGREKQLLCLKSSCEWYKHKAFQMKA